MSAPESFANCCLITRGGEGKAVKGVALKPYSESFICRPTRSFILCYHEIMTRNRWRFHPCQNTIT